jgi:hypothetical protein
MGRPGPHRGAAVLTALLAVAALTVLAAPDSVLARRATGAAAPVGPAHVDAAPVGPAHVDDGPVGPAHVDAGPVDAGPGGRPTGLRLTEVRGGWRLEDGLETAAAVGVLVGRAWAAAAAPAGVTPAVVLEAVEAPGPEAAVVTLLVAGVAGVAGVTGVADARVVRLAVPVLTGPEGVRPAGAPWVLPGPDLDPLPPLGRPLTDPALIAAARAALDRVGLDGASLSALEGTDGWPVLTRTADGGAGPWLRWHLDRFVVTGLPLRSAAGRETGTGGP